MTAFQIFVNSYNGKTVTINNVTDGTSVAELHRKIEEKLPVIVNENYYVIHVGRTLEEKRCLAYYKIHQESTVHLCLRVNGGADTNWSDIIDTLCREDEYQLTYDPDNPDDPDDPLVKMPCQHNISLEYLTNYCKNEIESGKYEIFCPYLSFNEKCNANWTYHDVTEVVKPTNEVRREFETKINENYFLVKGFKQCPKCEIYCDRYNTANLVVCRICTKLNKARFEFCWRCLNPSTKYKCNNSDCFGIDDILTSLREAPLKKIGNKNVPSKRACPKCGFVIVHENGCKSTTCTVCKQSFCFVCLKGACTTASFCKVAPVQDLGISH